MNIPSTNFEYTPVELVNSYMTSHAADIYLLDFGNLRFPSKVLSCSIYI